MNALYNVALYQELQGSPPFPVLADLLEGRGPALGAEMRHGVPREVALRRAVHAEFARTYVEAYLRTVLHHSYTPTAPLVREGIDWSGYGIASLKNREPALIDVVYRSCKGWDLMDPPRLEARAAIAKAYQYGLRSALVVMVNQNSQAWSFWYAQVPDRDIFGAPLAAESESDCASFLDGYEGRRGSSRRSGGVPLQIDRLVDLEILTEGVVVELAKIRSAGRKGGVISPSEVSTTRCDRRIAYALRKTERRDRFRRELYRTFDYGTATHNVLQRTLKAALPHLIEEAKVENSELMLYGSADLMDPVPEVCIEAKSMSTHQVAKSKGPKPEHQVQATIYARAGSKRYRGVTYLYVDKDTYRVLEYVHKATDDVWHQVASRCSSIVKTHRAGDLPPQTADVNQCTECPFLWTCKPQAAGNGEPLILQRARERVRSHA